MSFNVNSQNILPEWELKNGLVLVYPDRLPENRKELSVFYDSLINRVIEKSNLQELIIICRPEVKEKLKKKFSNISRTKIIYYPSKDVQDIWIRDFAPIAQEEKVAVKAMYSPSYFKESEKQFSDLDDKVGTGLKNFIKKDFLSLTIGSNNPIVIDGGNFIHNGKGFGIVTNRVVSDNESHSINEVQDKIKTQLKLKELLILPVEPGDETGHIDGMVRFLDESTVVVAQYPEQYEVGENNISEKEYFESQSVFNAIAVELKKQGFVVHRITNALPKNYSSNGIASAVGNYLNFLRIGNSIFIPQYGTKYDSCIESYRNCFPRLEFIPVNFGISNLAKLGGVLNCISWTY